MSTRYKETQARVTDTAERLGVRLTRNKRENAAKYLMCLEDGIYTDINNVKLRRIDGQPPLHMMDLIRELLATADNNEGP